MRDQTCDHQASNTELFELIFQAGFVESAGMLFLDYQIFRASLEQGMDLPGLCPFRQDGLAGMPDKDNRRTGGSCFIDQGIDCFEQVVPFVNRGWFFEKTLLNVDYQKGGMYGHMRDSLAAFLDECFQQAEELPRLIPNSQ